jgi:hypothetical protein
VADPLGLRPVSSDGITGHWDAGTITHWGAGAIICGAVVGVAGAYVPGAGAFLNATPRSTPESLRHARNQIPEAS